MDNVNIPQPVIDILELLHTKSSKAYLVGGCVRDMFMHLEPHDYDICSDLTPDIAMKVLSTKYPVIPKGIENRIWNSCCISRRDRVRSNNIQR